MKVEEKVRQQREARRKRILENAKSRLDKLKNVQSSDIGGTKAVEQKGLPQTPADASTADPPDEIIEHIPGPSAQLSPVMLNRAHASWLAGVVEAVKSDHGHKMRTVVIILCVLVVSLQNFVFGGYVTSFTISMAILDFTLMLWLAWKSKTQVIESNPLGWLTMMSVPLSFLHPLLPKLFETASLFVMLLTVLVKDILVVVFGSVCTFFLITALC